MIILKVRNGPHAEPKIFAELQNAQAIVLPYDGLNPQPPTHPPHSVVDLISRWGPPQQVFVDGQGGHVIVYTATRSYTVPGSSTTTTNINGQIIDDQMFGTATSQTVYNPAMTYQWQAYRMFFVDANGRIYRWAWRGF